MVPTVDGEEEVEIKAGHPAGHRDPAARQGRAAPPPGGPARRPPRPGRRRRADQAVEEGSASCSRPTPRSGRAGRPTAAAGCSRSSGWGEPTPADRRGDAADAGRLARARRSRPTSRRSRPSARSSAGWRRAGRRVEPGVRAGRRGPRRARRPDPAGDRPRLRARRATARAADRAVAEVAEALGHLQAFGLRPIGELRTRIVHEADWADAWKAYFPVLRVGRRLVIRPTWRRHRRAPDDVVLALDPGMAFGTGLHPTTRLCLGRARGARRPRARWRARASSTSAAARGSWPSRRSSSGAARGARRRHRPDRHRGDARQRAPEPARPPGARPRGQPAERRAGRSTSCSPTSSPGVLVPLAAGARATSCGPAARCSRRASSSTARREVARGVRGGRAGGRPGARPRATGSRSRPSGRA